MSGDRDTTGWGDEPPDSKGEAHPTPEEIENWEAEQYALAAKPVPWRLSHMMWLVGGVAIATASTSSSTSHSRLAARTDGYRATASASLV